jgi:hypothetical protein
MPSREDPSIRELASELEGFKELMAERDRRYEQRFEAMDEKTGLALTSSEKAVGKAEVATEKRFDSVNEFRSTLSDQAAHLLPRREADAKFSAYEDKLDDVKKEILSIQQSISVIAGAKTQQGESQQKSQWVIGLCIVIGLALLGFISKWVGH